MPVLHELKGGGPDPWRVWPNQRELPLRTKRPTNPLDCPSGSDGVELGGWCWLDSNASNEVFESSPLGAMDWLLSIGETTTFTMTFTIIKAQVHQVMAQIMGESLKSLGPKGPYHPGIAAARFVKYLTRPGKRLHSY